MRDCNLQIPKVFPDEKLDKMSTDKYPDFPFDVKASSVDLQIAFEKGFRKGEQISIKNAIVSMAHLLRCGKITTSMTNTEITELVTDKMKEYE